MLGLDWECRTPRECRGPDGPFEPSLSDSILDSGDDTADSEDEETEARTYKDDTVLRDQQSTGRKRAAIAFPLDKEKLCEWAGKKNCGGGKFPIVGCVGNLQQARHHGPDKNTLNNEKGNVHRICHTCHNRWHTLNDEGYVWNAVYDLHTPITATPENLAENERVWKNKKLLRAKD